MLSNSCFTGALEIFFASQNGWLGRLDREYPREKAWLLRRCNYAILCVSLTRCMDDILFCNIVCMHVSSPIPCSSSTGHRTPGLGLRELQPPHVFQTQTKNRESAFPTPTSLLLPHIHFPRDLELRPPDSLLNSPNHSSIDMGHKFSVLV